MLQGKPKDEAAARAKAEREAREDAQAEAEWGGPGASKTGWDGKPERPPPRTEKYDLKPYEPEDDDEYRTDEERAVKEPTAKDGAVRPLHTNFSSSFVHANSTLGLCKLHRWAFHIASAHQ